MSPMPSFVRSAVDVAASLPTGDATYAVQLDRPDATVGFYVLTGPDPQTPHKRDELYIVAEGTGTFVHGDRRTPFGPGDMLYVPAGEDHRFVDFGDRMAVWVVFFGPKPA